MRIPHAVAEGFRGQIQSFVLAAYPGRAAAQAQGGSIHIDARPLPDVSAADAAYIRKLRQGLVAQPELEKAWSLGLALGRLSSKRWVNPALMLFACGYYGHTAQLLLGLTEEDFPHQRRLKMAADLVTAPFGADPEAKTATQHAEILRRSNRGEIDDLIAHRVGLREETMPPEERTDRAAWSLDRMGYAALLIGWNRVQREGLDMTNGAIATAQFITERAIYPVSDRNRIVSRLIRDAISQ